MQCQEFWINNNLYLSANVSHAFQQAYHAASNHESLKQASRNAGKGIDRSVANNFLTISSAGNVIREDIELPPLTEGPEPKQQS